MRAQDFVKRNVAYHRELNPVAWRGNRLRAEVREHLLKIAEIFEHYLEIPNFTVQDIVLTGSMANYNYTQYSDFDLHVVTDYSDLQCDDVAEALYRAKKDIWNNQHDITIRGHETELYIEDVATPPVSGGVYSLLDDAWIKEPDYDPPVINNTAVNAKAADLIKQITVAIATADDPADLKRIRDRLRIMRRSGLDREGEFGVENLAFKILRNQGYLDQLNTAYLDQQDSALSLKEISMRAREFISEYDEYKKHTKIIHQAMRNAGYRRVGSGADSIVYAKDAGTVIKLIVPQENAIGPADQVFMAWYKFCQKNAGNPYLPKFVEIQGQHHATFDIDGETFRQIAMEKLKNLPTATFNIILNLEKSIRYNQSLEDTVMGDANYLYKNNVPPHVLKWKQRDLKLSEKLMAKYPGFYEMLQSAIATGKSLGFRDDVMSDGNIMMRADGTPVITDPWVI